MAHGAPDFSQYRTTSKSHPVSDLAELASRLGSPVWSDRRGDVIVYDTFELGLGAWDITFPVAGGTATAVTTQWMHSGYSLQLDPVAAVGITHRVARFLPKPPTPGFGTEIGFQFRTGTDYITLFIYSHDGVNSNQFALTYDYANKRLLVRDDTDTDQVIASNLNLRAGENTWHAMKLVVDTATMKYIRAILDGTQYDLSAYSAFQEESTAAPDVSCQFDVAFVAGANRYVYLDDIILTHNEPD